MKLKSFCSLYIALGLIGQRVVECKPSAQPARMEDTKVHLSLALVPDHSNQLHQTLHEISDPLHTRYGRYLSQQQADALSKPHDKALAEVKRWLQDSGVESYEFTQTNQFIELVVSAETADSLFAKELTRRNGQLIKSRQIPKALKRSVISVHQRHANSSEAIRRKHHFTTGKRKNNNDVNLEECKTDLTPACVRAIYRMSVTSTQPQSKSPFAVAGFDQQTAQRDQLQKFLAEFAPYAVGTNFADRLINGGGNPQGEYPSGEGNLDIQMAASLAYSSDISFISVGGSYMDFIPDLDLPSIDYGGTETFLELARYLVDLPDDKLPQVVVISYGTNEQLLPFHYANLVCNLFGQLGTRGVSVIVASGDSGPGASCQSNRADKPPRFIPSFPASCPYVTAVGATAENSPEIAATFSGGGFSDYFERPTWQNKVVVSYLNTHGEQWKKYYNASGRGIPDVAALGSRYIIYNHDNKEHADGTSASAPVFAAMIANLNNYRAQSNKPPLGFLNPWLYSIQNKAFKDITAGHSEGCLGTSVVGYPAPKIPGASWAAVPGWDPATGLGTPLFDRLKQLVCRRVPYTEGNHDSRLGVKVGRS